MPLCVVVDRLREIADELDEVLTAAHDLHRARLFAPSDMSDLLDRITRSWAFATGTHTAARRMADAAPERAVIEP